MGKAIFSRSGDKRKLIVLEKRRCDECDKEFQPKTQKSKYCSEECIKCAANRKYKDKKRHDGKRQELIESNGLVCSICGKKGNCFDIVAHHETFDKTDHIHQILLCRSCHAKIHGFGEPKHEIKLICEQCKKEFLATTTLKKYCSNKCKRKAEYLRDSKKIKERTKQWKIDNPERVKVNKNRYYLNNIEKCREQKRQYRLKRKQT